MSKQNRNTLKKYFKNGRLPSQTDFEALIDSNLNMVDEGFDKSVKQGFEITQIGDNNKLISLYKSGEGSDPLYYFRIDGQRVLRIRNRKDEDILSMSQRPDGSVKVLIGGDAQVFGNQPDIGGIVLDVGGAVRTQGRIGVVGRDGDKEREARADGKWHNITSELTGCQAFEVMAGVGGREGHGRYALVSALALNAYNPKGRLFNFLNIKKKIKVQNAYYGARRDKLKLRWYGTSGRNGRYCLQIRTNDDYGNDGDEKPIKIRYYCTELWFDHDMSRPRAGSAQ